MVVLAASVTTKSGKVLCSRQFVPMTRLRIEGLLVAFPKLVGTDSQHTFIETENVRYVYQPLEQLYLLLITNKQSNIMEDLDTLRLLAKVVPEYCGGNTEDDITKNSFELLFAFDEVLSLGHKESVSLQQIKTFTEMDSHEEKLQKIIMESKINEARDEARRKAESIDKQKAEHRKMQSMSGGGDSFGSPGMNDSFGSGNGSGSGSGSSFNTFEETAPVVNKPPSPRNVVQKKSRKAGKPAKGMSLLKAKKKDDFITNFSKEENIPASVADPMASFGDMSIAEADEPVQHDNVSVVVEETLVCQLDREGTLKKLEVKGEIKLTIFDPDDSKIRIETSGASSDKSFKYRLNPKINKKAWTEEGTLGLLDSSKGFPIGSDNAAVILKWRMLTKEDTEVPFNVNFWPNAEDGQTVVSVEYQAEKDDFSCQNVTIAIPCDTDGPPEVSQIDGSWHYSDADKVLLWQIDEISPQNDNGSMEFTVPECEGDNFFPLTVKFRSANTYSGIQILNVSHAEEGTDVVHTSTCGLQSGDYKIVLD